MQAERLLFRVYAGPSLRREGASSLRSASFVDAVPHCAVLAGLECVLVLFVRFSLSETLVSLCFY